MAPRENDERHVDPGFTYDGYSDEEEPTAAEFLSVRDLYVLRMGEEAIREERMPDAHRLLALYEQVQQDCAAILRSLEDQSLTGVPRIKNTFVYEVPRRAGKTTGALAFAAGIAATHGKRVLFVVANDGQLDKVVDTLAQITGQASVYMRRLPTDGMGGFARFECDRSSGVCFVAPGTANERRLAGMEFDVVIFDGADFINAREC